jgi:hypothetical protein
VKPVLSWLVVFTLAFLVWLALAIRAMGDPAPPDEPMLPAAAQAPVGPPAGAARDLEVAALRARVRHEHARYLAAHRRISQLTRTLAHTSSTGEAIELACMVYGSCDTLWRRARCESGVSTFARNPSGARGLFQFLPSTWASTPFAGFSIWSPYAQALAAGWMNTHGRGGEWACR